MVEINESERKKEQRMKRNEDKLRDLQDNMKCSNIQIIGDPEEDKKKDHEKIFEEIIVENFPKMGKEVGGGFMFGNTCTPVVDSCQCMAKPIQYCKVISLQLK